MTETKKDYISSIVFFLIGIGVLVSAAYIDDPELSAMGPREFPKFIGTCMVVLSTVLFVKTVYISGKHKQADDCEKPVYEKKDNKEARNNELRALAIAVICLLYAVTFTTLGYFLSSFIAIILIAVLFHEKRKWVYPLLFAVAVVIWLGFTYLLAIRLP